MIFYFDDNLDNFLGNLQLPFCVRGGVYNTPVVYVVVILSAKLSSSELFLVVYVVVFILLVCKIVPSQHCLLENHR